MRDRRSFLSGLATLPLIGGSVALIGQPTAAAVPVTPKLLDTYETWLSLERNFLRAERYGAEMYGTSPLVHHDIVFRNLASGQVHDWISLQNEAGRVGRWWRGASCGSRAAVVLSAAGVPIGGVV